MVSRICGLDYARQSSKRLEESLHGPDGRDLDEEMANTMEWNIFLLLDLMFVRSNREEKNLFLTLEFEICFL